jgi:uncharacterized protein
MESTLVLTALVKDMDNSKILKELVKYKNLYQDKYQFTKIGIFGSFARGTVAEQSDIDIMVKQKEPDLFILGNIKCDLEKVFGRKVDIVCISDGMNKFLKKWIDREGVYV